MTDRHAECDGAVHVTREDLVALLNDDLAREYQAVIYIYLLVATLLGTAVAWG